MPINIGNKKCKLYIGTKKIRKGYIGTQKIYSCGNIVTYHVDTGVIHQEEVDEDASCLSPKTFTPAKSGWEFAGWRQDKTASGSVLSSLSMGDTPVTLYAVFRQTITLSYNGNGNTGGATAAQTGNRYYNNGSISNPAFKLSANGFNKTGYVFSKWAMSSAGGTQYAAGASVTLAANTVMYAYWLPSTANVTTDSNYITYGDNWYTTDDGKPRVSCRAYVHDVPGQGSTGAGTNNPSSGSATITVNKFEPYNKAIIKLQPYQDNTNIIDWYEEKGSWAKLWINGTKVMDTKSSNYEMRCPGELTYTLTASNKTIEFDIEASITYDGTDFTWCYSGVTINSIVLSM